MKNDSTGFFMNALILLGFYAFGIFTILTLIYFFAFTILRDRSLTPSQEDALRPQVRFAANFFVTELNLEKYRDNIDLEFSSDLGISTLGSTEFLLDNNNEHFVIIYLDPSFYRFPWFLFDDPYVILAHEFVHAEQFFTGKIELRNSKTYWKEKPISLLYPYYLKPWEVDARERGDALAAKFKQYMKQFKKLN